MRRVGVMLIPALLALAGCGGGEPTAAKPKASLTPSATATPPDTGKLSAAGFSALNEADDQVQDAATSFQADIADCIGGGDEAVIQDCFAEKYSPYGDTLDAGLDAIDVAQDSAGEECASLLELAEDSARDLQQSSESMRGAFAEGDFAGVDAEGFQSAFTSYRSDMDSALLACASPDGDAPPTADGEPEAAAKPQETPAPEEQAAYDANAAAGLTQAGVDAARYCLKVTGERIGKNGPPSAALRKKRNYYKTLVGRVAENYPDIEIDGDPLSEYLAERAVNFASCDPKLSEALLTAITKLG